VFTAVGTHFSPYALSEAVGINPPDVPGGVSATAGSAGSGQITVSWSSVSGATGYYIYRDTSSTGSFPLLVDAGSAVSYANTGLTSGTTYYYKVSAYKGTGSPESAASNPVNASVSAVAGGGGGGVSIRASSSSSQSVSSAASSVSVASVPATSVASPSSVARSVSPVFNKNLTRGSKGEDVKNLQKLLAQDKTIYPEGIVSGVFGPMTEKAVKKFQAKYSLPQVGTVGPATRSILNVVASVSPSATVQQSSSSQSVSSSSISPTGAISKRLQKGMKDNQISTLQQWLSQDKDIYPEGTVSGFYGPLTEKAVQKFQEKYGIAGPGEAGYGVVGPKTRAKLSEIFGGN